MRSIPMKTAGAIAISAALLDSCGSAAYAADTSNMNTYNEVDELVLDDSEELIGTGTTEELPPEPEIAYFWVDTVGSKTMRVELSDYDKSAKYQLRYSANKNMKASKVLNISSKSGVKTFKVGSNDKKYFFEIRKGTNSNGKTTWSKWGDKQFGAAIAPPKIVSATSPKAKTLRVKLAKSKGKPALEYNIEYTGGNWITSGIRSVSKKSLQKTFTVGKSNKTYKVRACVWKKIGGEYFRSAYGPVKTVVSK